jgi:adenylyltransferase/sulfurtransferase
MDPARYARQIAFAPIGEEGQRALAAAHIAIIGMGALGSVSAELLVRAGVGFLRVIDRDYLSPNNLQRSVLYTEEDVRTLLPKAIAAQQHLAAINSRVTVEAAVADVNARSIENLIQDVDLVLDGTDNFEARYLINEACHKLGKPWIYGGALGAAGSMMVIRPDGPCFRCLQPVATLPGSYPTCVTEGVLATTTTLVASLQVTEALKLIIGADEATNDYRSIDVWTGEIESIPVERNPACKVCAEGIYEHLGWGTAMRSTALCGRDEIQVVPGVRIRVDLDAIAKRLGALGTVTGNAYLLDFANDEVSFKLFSDGRALIKTTDTLDEKAALSLYAQYVGL